MRRLAQLCVVATAHSARLVYVVVLQGSDPFALLEENLGGVMEMVSGFQPWAVMR